ncbi:MAG: threonine ammonia-lyase IlvA [Flavobacteriales bacterium]|nr:threonine ammonia-lyase IlvA [Flavobacteriales bacterium]
MDKQKYFPVLKDVLSAERTLNEILEPTPLHRSRSLSEKYGANVYLKREDLQMVRSYKIRGAYNKIRSLSSEERERGVVCASAGNHAQGVAYSCSKLGIKGKIFMPTTTPKQKISQVKMFGGQYVEVVLVGDTFDAASRAAASECEKSSMVFIHPFNDPKIIEGQATVGLEILQNSKEQFDFLFVPVGGGGLLSGVGSVFNQLSAHTQVIGVEPAGAAGMKASVEAGKVVELAEIDKFVDGAAVALVGETTYDICSKVTSDIVTVPEGKVCTTILNLYNADAIVVEPAGALSISALDTYADKIKGKNVVCIVSGSNNDITRMEEIKERSLLYEGLKHYFIISFPQRSGALKNFLTTIMGPTDDITYFEYKKKTSRDEGPALVGIEVQKSEDIKAIIEKMDAEGVNYQYVNDNISLFELVI